MKRKRHTPEEIIRKLRDADAQLAAGSTVADISKKLGVSENTFHRWRAQYRGMKAPDAKRLRELESRTRV
jgi:putative transposase